MPYSFTLALSDVSVQCAVPNKAVFCSALTSFFLGVLLRYFLNDFEMISVALTITGITFVVTFYMRCLLLLLLLL